jgi:hypothetical protein
MEKDKGDLFEYWENLTGDGKEKVRRRKIRSEVTIVKAKK